MLLVEQKEDGESTSILSHIEVIGECDQSYYKWQKKCLRGMGSRKTEKN